ncbi:ead/Ea22-like family protein, partial [Enterobacter hormaechei]
MSNIDKRADSVSRIIDDLKLKHGSGDTYAPIMRWDELLALLDELEAAEKRIAELERNEIREEGNQFLVVR